jgi:hypothetical protein
MLSEKGTLPKPDKTTMLMALLANFGLARKFDALDPGNEEGTPRRHATSTPFSFRGGAQTARGVSPATCVLLVDRQTAQAADI